uniref:Cytochrome p450 n=1 Tax=Moniliophthora roreri TaxID=221103 RepID=A0A0W0FRB2_MONRR
MTYGLSIKRAEVGDPVIDMAERALYSFTAAAVPGIFWVDYLPILKYVPSWFPGASFKRKARDWAKDADGMLNGPYDTVKANQSKGIVQPSFVSYCLGNIQSTTDKEELMCEEEVVREAAGAIFLAGTDTTVVALNTFILAMVCHPEVQRRAQEEIDSVVGPGRLPDFEDRENLPYIQAIVYEVMRYQPVTPLAMAHLATEEDEYKGYRIPKDSVVIGNTWALLHDEETYGSHPETFNPNRFLTPEGKLNPAIPEPISFFGFGRRICPGRHLALSTLFAGIASVLHSFDLSEMGTLSLEYESCLQNRPVPFKCSIKPRSPQHAELIQSAVQFTIIDE